MYFTIYLTIYLLCHITYHIPYRIPYHIPYIYSISYHIIHHIYNPLISLINSVSASRLCHCLVPRFKALAPPRCLLSHTQSNPLLPSLYTLHPLPLPLSTPWSSFAAGVSVDYVFVLLTSNSATSCDYIVVATLAAALSLTLSRSVALSLSVCLSLVAKVCIASSAARFTVAPI